jgi:hypothetical protein
MIFMPEILQLGGFSTYRETSAWLRSKNVDALLELKKGSWRLYPRRAVEHALKERAKALPKLHRISPARRPKGLLYGPDSREGKLAAAREASDPSRVGFATAALILGCSIFAVQRLTAMGKLRQISSTFYSRHEIESLARELIFLPEIIRRSEYQTRNGVMGWLWKEGVKPLFFLKRGDMLPAFDRDSVEKLLEHPISVGNSHPAECKRRLLDLVKGGSNVHLASKLCGIAYATAKAWVRINVRNQVSAQKQMRREAVRGR